MNDDALAVRLGANLKRLREARGLTQDRMAKLAGVPRATWGHLESGDGNPTLAVLDRVARSVSVPLDELIAVPRADSRRFPKGSLPVQSRAGAVVRKLLPDPIPGMEIERIELAAQGKRAAAPHLPGTQVYLACEAGRIELATAGDRWVLEAGDVVALRGDRKHTVTNVGKTTAVAYAVVVLARV